MRIALLTLALAACATMAPEPAPPTPEDPCGASRVASFVGRMPSEALVLTVLERSGARRVRWISPGDAVTMDYSPERLNVHMSAGDIIERFVCG